jgi:putative aldouronate transport system permease protein
MTDFFRQSGREKWERSKLLLLAVPGIAVIFCFHYLPLWGWSFAFFDYKPGIPLARSVFVGWDNFRFLFMNPIMRENLLRVLVNTLGMQMLGYLFSPLPMIFAVLLSDMHGTKFKKLVQTISTLPHFISWVIVFSLATQLFGSNGLVNVLIRNAGGETFNILQSNQHVWITQVLLGQWKGLGWSSIIYFAAIAGIDQEMYEAALVDGAGKMQRIWHITLPELIPTFFVLLIMSIGNFLNDGIDQYLNFGNALNMSKIEVLDLYVYNMGIRNNQISFSVAVGIMKSVIAIILFSLANMASKKIRGSSVF